MKVVQDKCKKITTWLVMLDIGFLTAEFPSQSDMEYYGTRGHIDIQLELPKDGNNKTLPEGKPKFSNINAEQHTRNELVWVSIRSHYAAFHAGYFGSAYCRLSTDSKSALATAEGWPASVNWRKLCNWVPEHEMSNAHRECYLAWRELERRQSLQGVENLLEASHKVKTEK